MQNQIQLAPLKRLSNVKTNQAEYRSVVRSIGGYLPERILTNEDLSEMVDTDDQWITERTGIKKRHIAAEGEFTSDLAVAAARSCSLRNSPCTELCFLCAKEQTK